MRASHSIVAENVGVLARQKYSSRYDIHGYCVIDVSSQVPLNKKKKNESKRKKIAKTHTRIPPATMVARYNKYDDCHGRAQTRLSRARRFYCSENEIHSVRRNLSLLLNALRKLSKLVEKF